MAELAGSRGKDFSVEAVDKAILSHAQLGQPIGHKSKKNNLRGCWRHVKTNTTTSSRTTAVGSVRLNRQQLCLLTWREAARALTLTRRPCKWVSRRAAGTRCHWGRRWRRSHPGRGGSDCRRPCNMGVCCMAYGCLVETRVIVTDAPTGRALLFPRPHLHFSSFLCACSPLKARCDYVQAVSVPGKMKLKWEVCAASNVSPSLEAIRCYIALPQSRHLFCTAQVFFFSSNFR